VNGTARIRRIASSFPPKRFTVRFATRIRQCRTVAATRVSVEEQRTGRVAGGRDAETLLVPPDSTVSPMIVLHASEVAPWGGT